MAKKRICSVDCGLTGGVALFIGSDLVKAIDMPITRICIQEALTQLKLDSQGKKQYYKSGANKNKPVTKIRRPAKYKNIIDVHALSLMFVNCDIVVIEQQNPRPKDGAKAAFTTGTNFGRVLAAAEVENKTVEIVAPQTWKAALHITMSKEEKETVGSKLVTKTLKAKAVSLATHLYPKWENSFKTERGALKDGIAEAVLIGHHHIKKGEL